MSKKVLFVLLATLFALSLTASKCDYGDDSADPGDATSVCNHIQDVCGTVMFDRVSDCELEVSTLELCRLECAVDEDSCGSMDQCLRWAVGYDGEVDNYCMSGGPTPTPTPTATPTATPTPTPNPTYTDLQGCSMAECPTQTSACDTSPDCTGIFDVCYVECADHVCLADCALSYYPNGIDAHDALYSCWETNCSAYMM